MAPITVVIADRQNARRAACLRLLRPDKRIRVVDEARSGVEVLAAAKRETRLLLETSGFAMLPLRDFSVPDSGVYLIGKRVRCKQK